MSFPKYPHPKDPNDLLDYEIDWSARLTDAETIVLSDYEVVSGGVIITEHRIDETAVKTVFWVSGGVEGETVYVRNRVMTLGGRQMDQTVGIKIKTL